MGKTIAAKVQVQLVQMQVQEEDQNQWPDGKKKKGLALPSPISSFDLPLSCSWPPFRLRHLLGPFFFFRSTQTSAFPKLSAPLSPLPLPELWKRAGCACAA